MIIVKDSEWVLSEVGDECFVFVNRRDKTVRLTAETCRYIIKRYDYALNLSYSNGVPRVDFTLKTKQRLTPPEVPYALNRVFKLFADECVINACKLWDLATRGSKAERQSLKVEKGMQKAGC